MMEQACDESQRDLHHNLLVVVTVSNIALLFLVGLLTRRLESLHVKLTRFIKQSRSLQQHVAKSSTAPQPAPPTEDVTRELVTGHVAMLKTTLSNQSLRSSLSADDFASLQCMLGDEDGITM